MAVDRAMGTTPPPPADATPVAEVLPLASATGTGKPYQRRADVEDWIGRVIRVPMTQWPSLAAADGPARLPSEVIVYLIKASQALDINVWGQLIHYLSRRMTRIAMPLIRGLDRETKEELIEAVQKKVVDLILQSPPCAQGDYLQIAFNDGVKQRTINAIAKRRRFPLPLRKAPSPSSDGEEEDESLTDRIPDDRPDPEELALAQTDRAEMARLLRLAKASVKDPRHYEAFVLRYAYGWQAAVKDPQAPSLAKRFGVSRRQIQTWLQTARDQIRAAIGDAK